MSSPATASSPSASAASAVSSHHTTGTTATSPADQHDADDDDDDIWDTTPTPTTTNTADNHLHSNNTTITIRDPPLSDLPSIRRRHMADGYREGVSAGKAQVMQAGFDAGFAIGVAVGLRAGRVLGVWEGVAAATSATSATSTNSSTSSSTSTSTSTTTSTNSTGQPGRKNGISRGKDEAAADVLDKARRELDVKELLGRVNDREVSQAEGVPALGPVEEVLRKWEEEEEEVAVS